MEPTCQLVKPVKNWKNAVCAEQVGCQSGTILQEPDYRPARTSSVGSVVFEDLTDEKCQHAARDLQTEAGDRQRRQPGVRNDDEGLDPSDGQ